MATSGKTKKAFLKRIKISSSGKIFKRAPGQNHFNAKDSGNGTRSKRGDRQAPRELTDKAKALIFN
ncbi:MAG TPA: 50S ribosomal protein L35 [Candidatus Paceibacterota bacterium]|jgi:ribosomal protein L35|nr:50S ribosomal protein L35 [Candidatus Paceibacterota bacterium]